ncbi:MAG: NAD-dependent epimerase/dehydratase family protein [Rhodospirillales bacterium]|nr:NAD-dependent epimerase/dehydratase family protein [Rhodospirillales bacterium]
MKGSYLDSDIAEIAGRLGEKADILAGKTVLLTGARGFLGRYFTRVFAHLNEHRLDKPCSVIALDNLITSGEAGKAIPDLSHFEFLRHDVIEPFVPEGKVDFVVHAAGIASPFHYRAHPIETLEVAIWGTRNMLDVARRDNAGFTFFSSSEIYGDPDLRHVPSPESYRGNVASQGPRACYDESKRVGETLCYIYHEYHGVHTNIIRPFNVFGPGMQKTDYRVLPNFAAHLQDGEALNVYGSGTQTRTFCYITDAMVGFLLSVLSGVPGETYNIGNPKPEISMLDLVERVAGVVGREVPHNVIEHPDSYPADEPNRRCPDIRKAELQLDYIPQVELDDGLSRFFTWADKFYAGS